MKLKLAGVAFGALMVGLVGAGEAKADAIGYASLVFNSAFFSAPGSTTPVNLTTDIDTNTLRFQDNLKNSATLNSTTAGDAASRNSLAQTTVDPALAVVGSYSGGENNFGFTANNTNFARSDSSLAGNLLQGNVQSNVVAETQVLNGSNGHVQTSSTNSSQVTFTATSALTLQFNVGGQVGLFTKLYNSNSQLQTADASILFNITIKNQTTGQTILNFSPDDLNNQLTAFNTPSQQGNSALASFGDTSGSFTLVTGDTYTLSITQNVQADATALPEPGTLALFGAGLAGLGFLGFRRQKKGGLAA
ncbi:hypothetical protein GCM10011611_15560 [Aliidongia dinghuensis]|uniref:Ice-binding protein C-terminal domain-containing protein n=1 Tax=Aliidongia dinghuensis TaxID=1867774 RepID=A0A8J3E2J7_9PROT|nr:EDSAP-1 family PEP-CTERM protein [Aliidongia dinghuensis]GGF10852.1 hypothetical protein GCM10011611_15560 [Aliidongia dinghuensis]